MANQNNETWTLAVVEELSAISGALVCLGDDDKKLKSREGAKRRQAAPGGAKRRL